MQSVPHATFSCEVVEGLADVGGVGLVVIRDLFVAPDQSLAEFNEAAEVKLAVRDQAVLGEDVRQQDKQLLAVGELAKVEDVESVAIHLLEFFHRFRLEVEVFCDNHSRQLLPQLRDDPLRMACLVVV